MKKINVPCLFVSLISVLLGSSLCIASDFPIEHEVVEAALEEYAEAFACSNAERIAECLAGGHRHVNPFGSEIRREALLRDIRSGRLVFDQYELESYKVTPLSYGLYLATGVVHACAHREGKEMSGHFRFVHILSNGGVGLDDIWKSIYTQHTKILSPVVENDSLETFIDP